VRAEHLQEEQAAVDRRYARLDALRAQVAERLRHTRRAGPSGSPQNRSERDAFATLYEDRLAQLDAVEQRLTFGRLDLQDGTTHYVGRIGLTDDDHTVLLTDWRAPAAQPFYRATAAQPDGVVRRRHLVTRGRTVTGVEDEVLDLDALAAAGTDVRTLSGEGALLASLGSARTGRMGDIVATIQAEQDAVIRSDLAGALVVQGGPGTGKTAVALHRAAYLLYAHRRTLERSGVLLVGPSRVFLRYIDQVLPSLGETGVVTVTLAELFPGVVADGEEPDEVAEIKGRLVWPRILARAVRQRQGLVAGPREITIDGRTLRIDPRDVADAAARARRGGQPHNVARVAFVRDMLGRLAEQYAAQMPFPIPPEDRADLVEELRATRDVRVALNLAWLPLTPQRLLESLWTHPERLEAAAPELTAEERALLARPAGSPWTPADVPLLDEAAELLGEDDQAQKAQAAEDARRRAADVEYARQVLATSDVGGLVSAELLADRFAAGGPTLTTAERAAADRSWTYGHVIVDEAQELSAMAWRMLVRRVPTRSMTIAGDLAQTSSAGGARSWAEVLSPSLGDSWRVAELTVNYRTPAAVARAAQEVAAAAGLPTSPLTSAREVPDALVVRRVPDDALAGAVVDAARAALAELDGAVGAEADAPTGAPAAVGPGRVVVVAAPERAAALRAALEASDVAPALGDPREVLDARLAVLTPRATKGLEFDVVVLVEPAEIERPGDLYVAMTRATRALHVLAAGPLPAGLTATDGETPTDGAGRA
jgi:DNA helicase IV